MARAPLLAAFPAALPAALAALGLSALAGAGLTREDAFDAGRWRQAFARPAHAPMPAGNPTSPPKVALGARLFEDPRLSGDGTLSCASCHQPDLSFSDGVPRHAGRDHTPLGRRTPSLWNLAWGATWFWDGRATSLEDQVAGPVANPLEMAGDLDRAAALLARDPAMARAFAEAFPEDPQVSATAIARALAAFERSLVSPETRFDRWVKGEEDALAPDELAGLRLFVGKAACVNCHSGWRFTDEAFHDIGLPGQDRGRGAAIGLPAADHAFKTPSLRERVWTAPYMHDGSLASFEEVVAHYADGAVPRPTLSADLPRALDLAPEERAQLVAFLATLSSEDPPRPASLPARAMVAGAPAAVRATAISQKDRRFSPAAVLLRVGEALRIVNDDTRTHNVRLDGPGLSFSSDAQSPGDTVTVGFDRPGRFEAICGIHPEMRLTVEVTQAGAQP